MNRLRIILRYLVQPLAPPWRRRNQRPRKVYPVLSVDPEEFSSLLGSGGSASAGCVIVVAVFEAPAIVTGLDDVIVVVRRSSRADLEARAVSFRT